MTRPTSHGRALLALLPIRLFFGVTFIWAGLDKLLDPTFLDPSAATSLHAQLVGFARFSPLGAVIEASLPYSSAIGVLIAVGEIGAGLGALTGLAYRIAAVGGLLLSVLFWLTASWATRPYYFGADLPYAIGWLTLALAGHGDVLVVAAARSGPVQRSPGEPDEAPMPGSDSAAPSPSRRQFLQAATLAALSAAVASFALPLRGMGLRTGSSSGGVGGIGGPGGSVPTPGPTAGPSPTLAPTIPPDAVPVARLADVRAAGSAAFTVPFDAPSPLPAGDPGVIVQLADGSFAAFDTICTHAGCTVEWDQENRLLICPCHDAIFDAEHGAAVLEGPAPLPLTELPLVIDVASGTILLVPKRPAASGAGS